MNLEQGESPLRSQTKLDTNLSFYLLFKTSVGKNKQIVRETEPEKNRFSSFWLSSSEESEKSQRNTWWWVTKDDWDVYAEKLKHVQIVIKVTRPDEHPEVNIEA